MSRFKADWKNALVSRWAGRFIHDIGIARIRGEVTEQEIPLKFTWNATLFEKCWKECISSEWTPYKLCEMMWHKIAEKSWVPLQSMNILYFILNFILYNILYHKTERRGED